MDKFDWFMGGVLAVLAIFQAWLTVRVLRSDLYDRKQKIWQTQLIWFVPIIGAGLVFYILSDQEEGKPKTSR